jgi:hypothetical protein
MSVSHGEGDGVLPQPPVYAERDALRSRVAELEAWVVDEVDPMNLSEPRRSEWHTLHEKLHPENYN